MYILGDLEPKNVFRFFEELSRIPRGSGNEKAASDYVVAFAKERGLWVHQDAANNVIIKKPATPGYENAPGVIIQGHIDMVNEKNQDTVHDFEKDPIKLVIDGDLIKADGTTLGADNGVAVALGMAVLDASDLQHPALEILFTTDEEVGMNGANAVDGSLFQGKRLINLDCGPEGEFCAGCSGGMRQVLSFQKEYADSSDGYVLCAVRVRGLNGGHSGAMIDEELANANKLMGRILTRLHKECDIFLGEITGGSKENAIPREADALVYIKNDSLAKAEEIVDALEKVFIAEYRKSENGIHLIFEKAQGNYKPINKAVTKNIIAALNLIPYGRINKSMDIEGLTETSSNLGVVTTDEDMVNLISASRSSVTSRRTYMKEQFIYLAEYLGATYKVYNEYPGWEFNPESTLRDTCMSIYKEMFDKDPILTATHGGLECGLLSDKIPGVDIVAMGPTADGAHTPEENLSISSMERTWRFLVKVLENLKD